MTGTTQAEQDEAQAGSVPDDARERTYTWADPLQTAAAAAGAGLSGLEFFEAMTAGRIPRPPIMDTLGVDSFSVQEDGFEFRLTPRDYHYNPIGSVHGGVFATLLDSACGCAVHVRLPAGVLYTSLDLSVKFLRPVSVGTGQITAVASVVHLGRRTALAEGRIVDAAGRIYATATSSCLIIRP